MMLSYLLVLAVVSSVQSQKPVILIPGLGGSQLEAKLNRPSVESFHCFKHSDWYTIWFSLQEDVFSTLCTVENLQLIINPNGTTSNKEGVWIRAPGFGQTETVEWLGPSHLFFKDRMMYMKPLVDRLVAINYTRGFSVRAAPYDFRKAPNEMAVYMVKLRRLIEETYIVNGDSKVVLIGHSMGGNIALYFLQQMSPEWKDKHIEAFISLSAPYAGSVKTLKTIATGDSFGVSEWLISPAKVHILTQSMPSAIWLMPYSPFWSDDEVLLSTKIENFTVKNYKRLFLKLHAFNNTLLRRETENLLKLSEGPGVKTICMYGTGEDNTPAAYKYDTYEFYPDNKPEVTYGPGDGTVNKRSLEACRVWHNTDIVEFKGVGHSDIVRDENVLNFIADALRRM